MLVLTVLYIKNIVSRSQCDAIVSIPVRCDPRDFRFAVLAQDDQRIFCVISAVTLCRGISSHGSTAILKTIFKWPSSKPGGAALVDRAAGKEKKAG
ncbi:MAG: hypothetical protein DMF44_00215 [Verrucomicrobia bacterium]|nr:MAG: hypothetical protein DMF44_00215 [Verrucomicrobiota bacterium]